MSKAVFINLSVTDVAAASRFYAALGCKKNELFSDSNSASMMWSDTINFQLLSKKLFSTFTNKPMADVRDSCVSLIALTRDSRAEVDALAQAAAAAGGKADVREPVDLGWLYNRAFEDVDGHMFEAIWMDMKQASEQMSNLAAGPA